jgi:hypothetical protein
LNVSVQTGRFATARPLDQFAQQFVQFLDDNFYIQYGVKVDSKTFLQSIKVLNCSEPFWRWLLATRETKMAEGSPLEYNDSPSRSTIAGLSMSAVSKHRTTKQEFWIPREAREAWLRNIFPNPLAHELAPYDGLIFLYKPDRWATKLNRMIDPSVSTEDFELAKWLTIATAPYIVTAHECLHLVLRMVGGEMPTWNPASSPDPVDDLFFEYLSGITLPVFELLYLRNSPQADDIL